MMPEEAARVNALHQYHILDTLPEFDFDALAELAAQICDCPAALIGLIDERREFLKAKYGLPFELTECPRDISVCNEALCRNDLLYIPDTTKDERFKNCGTVIGEPYVRFYCGMPLINPEGYALGTFCVIDFTPRDLSPRQQDAIRRLARQTMAQLELRRQVRERDETLRQLNEARAALLTERDKSELLLRDILPAPIAQELKDHRRVQPRYYESASILFADFKAFTHLTERLDPVSLIGELDRRFAAFDDIVAANRLEKLKTIGDAYLCVGGVPDENRSHTFDACLAALQMQALTARSNRQREKLRLPLWELRIGINTGSLVAGVVGKRKFTYDVWGNAVNVAERMEAACAPGAVNIAATTAQQAGRLFEVEPRGQVDVKHKGPMEMYFLRRIRPEFSADAEGMTPNAAFWQAAGGTAAPIPAA
ncbi:MAG TPA: adenylate/guanylate cyclase domain-containing protein [Ferrovibrio sp.]|uniref:adenylate/guanylate cyclase domain-containing protein n=1 Tax=Ferrovibrio sp. TaxID=1917215 RepID=UPI002ED2BA2F